MMQHDPFGPAPEDVDDRAGGAWLTPKARRIVEEVERTPGIHKRKLCRRIDMPWATLRHHLQALEDAGLVKSHRQGRQVHLFPASLPEGVRALRVAETDPLSRTILGELREHGLLRVSDIQRRHGHCRKTIRRHLDKLAKAGLVRRTMSRQARYFLATATDHAR